MTEIQWHQRLHWRGAITFLLLLIAVEIPFWMLAWSLEVEDPERAMARALGLATVGALATIVLHTIAASIYMRRRMDATRRVLLGSVAGERLLNRVPDEISLLVDEVGDRIHEMRASMVRLQQERGRLRALLEGMEEAVLMLDDAERVLVANTVAEKLLHLSKNYVGGRLSAVCDVPRLQAVVSEVLWAHEPSALDIDFMSKGEVLHVAVTAYPIMSGENATGVVIVMHDLTQLRRLERVRRDFVANVSHELRTPIATIRSAAETLSLANLELDPELREFLPTIERNADRMGTLVEDLLVLSRLEAAGEEISLHDVSLSAVFAGIVDQCDPFARERGVELIMDVEEDLPRAYAEEGALTQILQNLIENGIKYTPSGGSVTVTAHRKGAKRLRLTITDTGPGIGAEHLPRIFERFYRVDVGRSRDIGGTGLGLAIVKHLVRKLKGKIEVESEPDHGTSFTLDLRAYRPEKAS